MSGINDVKSEINKIGIDKSVYYAAGFFKNTDSFLLLQARFNANKRAYFKNDIEGSERDRENLRIQESLYYFLDEQDNNILALFLEFIRTKLSGNEMAEPIVKKILFVSASPDDLPQLKKDVEFNKLKNALDQFDKKKNYALLPPLFAAKLEDLLLTLNQDEPHLVHFSGHGTNEGLMLVDEKNNWVILSNEDLERILKSRKNYIKYVFLNSCYSSSQAQLIPKYCINVIGNTTFIADDAGITFAELFYKLLFSGSSFEDSFRDSKMALNQKKLDTSSLEFWPGESSNS